MIIVSDDIVNTEPEAAPAENLPEDKDTEIVEGAKYRHFKGGEYQLIALARHSVCRQGRRRPQIYEDRLMK